MVQDGFCDDENNNRGCNFDGGDCCKKTNPGWGSPGWNQFCNKCACRDPCAFGWCIGAK